MENEDFQGDAEAPKLTPDQAAFQRRQQQKSDKHERITKELTSISQRFPDAYKVLKEYIDYEIFTMESIISNANDSDLLLKYSGSMRMLKEMQEKLDLYTDFS